jgi:glycosyltransferase involved in cell wall biosynthesis
VLAYTGRVERLPLRRLVTGPRPTPDRLFYSNIWFREHNNPRYEALLPRLSRLDRYLMLMPRHPVPRGVVFRTLWNTRRLHGAALLRLAARSYPAMFTSENEQIPHFHGPIVADVDDPKYTQREVALLNRKNVRAYVVTAERAGRAFEELGVRTPWQVIPQGINLRSYSEALTREIAARHRRDGEIVVGHMAAWLLSGGDRGGDDPLYNVDHLLDLWDEIRPRVPSARLWLVGGASERVRARVAGRDDVLLFGRLPREQALSHAANFDLALYARTADQGIRAAKVAEYMGLGTPTVSYDYRVTEVLRETGAGVLVREPREFVDAVVALAADPERRAALAAAAAAAGRELDWDVLARRYEREILDLYLPPGAAIR